MTIQLPDFYSGNWLVMTIQLPELYSGNQMVPWIADKKFGNWMV